MSTNQTRIKMIFETKLVLHMGDEDIKEFRSQFVDLINKHFALMIV